MESAPQPTRSFRSCLPGASLFPRLTFQRFAPFTSPSFNLPPENVQDLSFQPLAGSFLSPKKSSPLESSKSSLFFQNTRGGGIPQNPPFGINKIQALFSRSVCDLVSPRPSAISILSPCPPWQICGAERTLPPRHESDTAATEGSRSGTAPLGGNAQLA
jgi:hypothetical protein